MATDPATPIRYRRQRDADLACEPLWPGVSLLCFRVWEGGERRWVESSDLERWGVGIPELKAALAKQAPSHLKDAEIVEVGGMSEKYLRLADGDGWAAAALLAPQDLAARVGERPIRAALPGEGVLLAWKGGSEELDRVMAVGVRELYEGASGGLSPVVYQWDGKAWLPFGEAVPRLQNDDAPPE